MVVRVLDIFVKSNHHRKVNGEYVEFSYMIGSTGSRELWDHRGYVPLFMEFAFWPPVRSRLEPFSLFD